MGEIQFTGNPPYALSVLQAAEAKAKGETVEVILRVTVPGKNSDPARIYLQMTVAIARSLEGHLASAIAAAAANSRDQASLGKAPSTGG